jgi:hypothetical protein
MKQDHYIYGRVHVLDPKQYAFAHTIEHTDTQKLTRKGTKSESEKCIWQYCVESMLCIY